MWSQKNTYFSLLGAHFSVFTFNDFFKKKKTHSDGTLNSIQKDTWLSRVF